MKTQKDGGLPLHGKLQLLTAKVVPKKPLLLMYVFLYDLVFHFVFIWCHYYAWYAILLLCNFTECYFLLMAPPSG